ncbi:MAG TPA: hypothetical protein VLX91_15260 [Candidatus Acidoferrales bacterium]|nr:hypothetical protein [Candidatus Acidoferrales bacterium]
MKAKILTDIPLVVCCSLSWVLFSFILSIVSCQWLWFSRSGSVITLAGGILAVRRLLRLGVKGFFHSQHTIDGGHYVLTPDEIESNRQELLDDRATYIGVCFIIIGTMIWAYGDLL